MAISKVLLPHFPLPGSRSSGQGVLTWELDSSVDGSSEITLYWDVHYYRNFHLQYLLWCFPYGCGVLTATHTFT